MSAARTSPFFTGELAEKMIADISRLLATSLGEGCGEGRKRPNPLNLPLSPGRGYARKRGSFGNYPLDGGTAV